MSLNQCISLSLLTNPVLGKKTNSNFLTTMIEEMKKVEEKNLDNPTIGC